VQVANRTELTTFAGWTIRIRPSPEPKRLLLLIHGLTGDENSMWVFVRALSANYWIVAPRAPYPAQAGGYSWRPPGAENLEHPDRDDLAESAMDLLGLVDRYAASIRIGAAQFDVIGFSQGAALTTVLAFLHPERIRKAAILAGFVPGGLETSGTDRPLRGKAFFVAHGTQDERISVQRASASVSLLERAGATVTYCEGKVGHKVSAACLRALEDFMQAE